MSAPARGSGSPLLAWFTRQSPLRSHLIAFAAGALSNLAFAPAHVFPALAGGLVTLIWLLDAAAAQGRTWRAMAGRVWSFGFGFFLFGLYWIASAFLMVDGAAALAPFAVLALAGGLALFWAGAFGLAAHWWRPGPARLVLFTLALMAGEGARGALFGGFPWNIPAYVWSAGGAVSQLAASIGVWGLSALTVLAFVTPATLADPGPIGRRVAPGLTAALALGLAWGFGGQRLNGPALPPQGVVVRVADAGLSQQEKWRPGAEYSAFSRYAALIDTPGGSQADVVVWPESALPTLLLDQPEMMQALGARLGDKVLVTGLIRAEATPERTRYYNSAAILDGVNGRLRIGQIYDKHRLVPFGEFIPLWSRIEPLAAGLKLKALQQIGSGFEAGDRPVRLIVPGAGAAVILICYESIFPGLVPRGAERPDWILNLTNDSWFGAQTGPYQHYNQARFRAIEEGLPMVRAASGGVSALIDPYGRPVRATGLAGGVVEAPLPEALPPTPYSRWGGFTQAIVFFAIILLGLALRQTQGARKP